MIVNHRLVDADNRRGDVGEHRGAITRGNEIVESGGDEDGLIGGRVEGRDRCISAAITPTQDPVCSTPHGQGQDGFVGVLLDAEIHGTRASHASTDQGRAQGRHILGWRRLGEEQLETRSAGGRGHLEVVIHARSNSLAIPKKCQNRFVLPGGNAAVGNVGSHAMGSPSACGIE